jgi:hypothetical protein
LIFPFILYPASFNFSVTTQIDPNWGRLEIRTGEQAPLSKAAAICRNPNLSKNKQSFPQ